jgi:hypothetical protein
MATKKMAAKKMVAKKVSPMKQGLPPGAEITGKYNQRVERGQRNFASQGSKFGEHAGVSISSDLQATAKPFNRRYADTPDGYTEVYGYGANGKEQRIFRGRTGMKSTDDFVRASESKVKEVNARRTKNENAYNAMQGPISTFSNPAVLSDAIGLGNVRMNTRTGQSPANQMKPMSKKSKKAAPAKMKKC